VAILAVLLLALPLPMRCRPAPAGAQEAPDFLDPDLAPAWALLLGVDVDGRPLGAELADARERAGVAIEVGPMDPIGYSEYRADEARIVIREDLLNEDPRAVAAVLAHELTHVQQGLHGLLFQDACAMNEAWAMAFEPDVWEPLTGGELPSRTRLEAALTRNAAAVRRHGVLGMYGMLAHEPGLGRACVVGAG
jgi:hypothetical protein